MTNSNTAYVKRRRLLRHKQHQAHPELTPHGTYVGYEEYGCRCLACAAVKSAANARYQEKMRSTGG